jgi:hypothetical protein
LSHEDKSDFNSYRGNVFQTANTDEEGALAEKDSLGRMQMHDVTDAEAVSRRNYQKADNINYEDGDEPEYALYNSGTTTLIDDKARVVKGGSWKDRVYYMTPGSRRFLDQSLSTDWIGFRCAMARVGSPTGLGSRRK